MGRARYSAEKSIGEGMATSRTNRGKFIEMLPGSADARGVLGKSGVRLLAFRERFENTIRTKVYVYRTYYVRNGDNHECMMGMVELFDDGSVYVFAFRNATLAWVEKAFTAAVTDHLAGTGRRR